MLNEIVQQPAKNQFRQLGTYAGIGDRWYRQSQQLPSYTSLAILKINLNKQKNYSTCDKKKHNKNPPGVISANPKQMLFFNSYISLPFTSSHLALTRYTTQERALYGENLFCQTLTEQMDFYTIAMNCQPFVSSNDRYTRTPHTHHIYTTKQSMREGERYLCGAETNGIRARDNNQVLGV